MPQPAATSLARADRRVAGSHYHFAVIGNSPLAGLLAGLLKSRHGREVCLISDASMHRLERGIDLSAGIITRPESWRLLHNTRAEALKLLTGIAGRRAVERADLRIDAHHPDAVTAIAHMRHVAAGYGVAIDRQHGNSSSNWLMRDTAALDRPMFRAALGDWLGEMAVPRFDVPDGGIKRDREGRMSFTVVDDRIEAAQVILADDESILTHADPRETTSYFRIIPSTSILTEPAERMHQPASLCADDGAVTQQLRNGSLVCLVPAPSRDALRLAGCRIGASFPVNLAGLIEIEKISTRDGAMSVGWLPRSQATVIAGTDPFAAFLAPALARFISGEASEGETDYFTARAPSRRARAGIAEFNGVSLPGAVA